MTSCWRVETGTFDAVEDLGKTEKAMRGGHGENTQRSRHPETFAQGDEDAVPIVHQDQIGVEFDGESNGVFLTCIEFCHRGIVGMRGRVYLCPCRRVGNPLLHRRRCFPVF